jgi:hypothetical protein
MRVDGHCGVVGQVLGGLRTTHCPSARFEHRVFVCKVLLHLGVARRDHGGFVPERVINQRAGLVGANRGPLRVRNQRVRVAGPKRLLSARAQRVERRNGVFRPSARRGGAAFSIAPMSCEAPRKSAFAWRKPGEAFSSDVSSCRRTPPSKRALLFSPARSLLEFRPTNRCRTFCAALKSFNPPAALPSSSVAFPPSMRRYASMRPVMPSGETDRAERPTAQRAGQYDRDVRHVDRLRVVRTAP